MDQANSSSAGVFERRELSRGGVVRHVSVYRQHSAIGRGAVRRLETGSMATIMAGARGKKEICIITV